ncbi:peptidase E [Halobacillus litoralis]|uniref:Peptidase E n=1 Tax=Halobacillus litoralis TaxID=45668 RepID=A0A410MCU5_9BACI|nr:peptidase E [Halobacillus litoralis]QAS52541.1 peptidase E [Halobacillus litoralis]
MKQIIAMGGGGFSMEPENLLLDEYVLAQVGKTNPKICFLPTASGDAQGYIERFYSFFGKKSCEPTHLSLFSPPSEDLRKLLLSQDIIYVGGGSTKNMLILWRAWGIDEILKEALDKGVLLAGLSAGAICWFEEGLTDSYGDHLEPLAGLGFLSGSCCPHYDGEKERRPSYTGYVEEGAILPGYGLYDGVAVHFVDGKPMKVVSSREASKGFFVTQKEEKPLEIEYLGYE